MPTTRQPEHETPPRIPWFEPLFDASDADAVGQVLADAYVNEGPRTRALERQLAERFGTSFAVTTPNCTTALALALMAAGVGAGDTVLVPDVTFIGTASAVRLAGADPIIVDVEPATFTIDPDAAEKRLQPNTKAILPVHLNGRPADMAGLRALAEAKGLSLLEDAAEAIGSRSEHGYLGTLSRAGCFSLAPTKIITSGQGGFVLTAEQEIRDNLVRLKDHGRLSRESDVHPVTGFNFKFTDLQAALALSQLARLDARIERAREIDRRYLERLEELPGLAFPERPGHGGYLMWPDFTAPDRDRLVAALAERGIVLRPFWPALHTQPAYAQEPDLFPGATQACAQGCWLPCAPGITDTQLDTVATAVVDFLSNRP